MENIQKITTQLKSIQKSVQNYLQTMSPEGGGREHIRHNNKPPQRQSTPLARRCLGHDNDDCPRHLPGQGLDQAVVATKASRVCHKRRRRAWDGWWNSVPLLVS